MLNGGDAQAMYDSALRVEIAAEDGDLLIVNSAGNDGPLYVSMVGLAEGNEPGSQIIKAAGGLPADSNHLDSSVDTVVPIESFRATFTIDEGGSIYATVGSPYSNEVLLTRENHPYLFSVISDGLLGGTPHVAKDSDYLVANMLTKSAAPQTLSSADQALHNWIRDTFFQIEKLPDRAKKVLMFAGFSEQQYITYETFIDVTDNVFDSPLAWMGITLDDSGRIESIQSVPFSGTSFGAPATAALIVRGHFDTVRSIIAERQGD